MDPFRLQKAETLRTRGRIPYAAKFPRTHALGTAKDAKDGTRAHIAGRVMLWRDMGKMTFATLQDHTGRLQVAFREDILGGDGYKDALALIDLGDIIGIEGERFTTQAGEPTVLARTWTMLTKTLRQPPEKWHGLADQETAWRQRYIDLSTHPEVLERFTFRSLFIRKLREFYWSRDFIEVDTPVLVNAASGALAKPFRTHHDAYDMDVFLRIAPETFLKECLVGGFDRVFEIARVFRNEGLDPSHLQDFTMAEHYAAYWDDEANMAFTEEMFVTLLKELRGSLQLQIPDRDGALQSVDFETPWPRFTVREVIERDAGIDIDTCATAEALRKAIHGKGITLDVPVEKLGRGTLMDQLYKKVSRPKITQPTFIVGHPIDLSPLARRNDVHPDVTDRFQLVLGGWEIVNAYSEIIDPRDQAQRFEEQAKIHAQGDVEAHRKDDEYVAALAYGCPPCSGWGLGVDRIVALFTQQRNLRDVVLFPLMKPRGEQSELSVTPGKTEKTQKTQRKNSSGSSESFESPDSLGSISHSPPASPNPQLLQHTTYGHFLPAAHGLLMEHAKQTRAHLVATGAAMEALAKHFGGDSATWKVAGMLHDLDWDHLDKDYEKHCGGPLETMLSSIKAPEELLGDIRAHYASKYGAEYPLDTALRKCLYCVDELTGFIIAVTLVRPSKKLADVEVKSITKKMKDKAFAAQVDRAQIMQCEKLLGIPLDAFVRITLDAMKGVATEIGL